MIAAGIAFLALFILLFLGLPIGFGMLLVGTLGFAYVVGLGPALAMVGQIPYDTGLTYAFSVLPLFLLMGNLVAQSRLSQDLYDASHAFLGHHRGGLAMATIVACAGFASVCGSSMATAATMTKVSMPPMQRYGYAPGLAAGSIAAGGTLGILIPPSVIMVIYGIMTETDIGKLFIAGVIPGLLGVLFYMLAVIITTRLDPKAGPPGPRAGWPERLRKLGQVWGVLMLFALVMGGIYFGVFTPTEAAGIGATGSLVFAIGRRALSLRQFFQVLLDTGRTTAMMMFVLTGSIVLSNFVNVSGVPQTILAWIQDLQVAPIVVILIIMAIYLVLGCVLESLSMILLTIPIFYPLVQALGFDLIWFGILIVVVVEISLITPPIGMNVFMLKALLPDVPTGTIFRGVMPFVAVDLVRLALFVLVPSIILFLPRLMS